MKSQTRHRMKRRAFWSDRLITRRRTSIFPIQTLFAIGMANDGIVRPETGFDLSTLLLFLILIVLYLYVSYRFASFIFLFGKVEPPFNEQSATLTGGLKLSDLTSHSLLEREGENQVSIASAVPIERLSSSVEAPPRSMRDFIGKGSHY